MPKKVDLPHFIHRPEPDMEALLSRMPLSATERHQIAMLDAVLLDIEKDIPPGHEQSTTNRKAQQFKAKIREAFCWLLFVAGYILVSTMDYQEVVAGRMH